MSCQCGACCQTPNEASCQHSYCHGLSIQHYRSPSRAAGAHQFTNPQVLSSYSVGEMMTELMAEIARLLDLNNNTGTRKLADYLGLNCLEFWTLQDGTSPTWALYKKCFHEGIKMDRIFQGLITIRSDGANLIENKLNDIHGFVCNKRAQQRPRPSGDPQQDTDSCISSSGDGFNNGSSHPSSSMLTCRCDSRSMASQRSVHNQPPNDTPQSLGSHDCNRNSYYQSFKRDRLSQIYHSGDTQANVHKMHISNPSSDEEWDEVPKKRKARAKAYIFITGGNSSQEMMTIGDRLGSLSRLPYKLIWDSPNLIDEDKEQWERKFSEAAIVVIGLTKDYAANISRGGDWPSRAKQINQYVQRELTKNTNINKRFISVIMTKSGLKKDDLPWELSGTPYKWPDQDELLKNRLEVKMDTLLKTVK